jgi:hypothetical protein
MAECATKYFPGEEFTDTKGQKMVIERIKHEARTKLVGIHWVADPAPAGFDPNGLCFVDDAVEGDWKNLTVGGGCVVLGGCVRCGKNVDVNVRRIG